MRGGGNKIGEKNRGLAPAREFDALHGVRMSRNGKTVTPGAISASPSRSHHWPASSTGR